MPLPSLSHPHFSSTARLVVLASGAAIALTACSGQPHALPSAAPAEVGVITTKIQPVTLATDLPGRTSAFRSAEVRPQVNGVILKRSFVEGSDVKAGQQLYQIDPAPYEAAVESAQATLASAEAAVVSARLLAERYKTLSEINAVSKQDYANAVATLGQDEAAIASAKAALKTAQINLIYTRVLSPISGRIGRSSVTEGALVTANQTSSLANVSQLDPIYVDVTEPATELLELQRHFENGQLKRISGTEAEVRLTLEDGTPYDLPGKLEFSEVTVDETTGTVTVRARFPNPKARLLPGLFVHEQVTQAINETGILVPQQGVTHDDKGNPTALVVGQDNKVELRQIKTDQTVGNQWLVTGGLKAGERVIVAGVQKTRPGAIVKPSEVDLEHPGPAAAPGQAEPSAKVHGQSPIALAS
jgi:membrane fusion protein (multidrug efflux system)